MNIQLSSLICLLAVSSGLSVQAQSQNEPIRVRAVRVDQEQVLRSVTQPASIEPWYRTEIRAKLSAYVSEVKADIGTVVHPGDVLAVLDAPEMNTRMAIIEARIERLLAEEGRARSGVTVATANLESAAAAVRQAKAQVAGNDAAVKAAQADLNRISDLVNRGSLEARNQDIAMRTVESATAGRTASEAAIQAAEAGITVARAKIEAAEAELKVAQTETQIARTELQELQVMMKYLTLTAPFSGVVTSRSINPGDLVATGNAGGKPLFEVIQLNKVRCRIDIPERDAAFVRPGDEVSLTLPSFPDEKFTAKVSRAGQSLNEQTRTMQIEADIDNPKGRLLPGMFGQATVTMGGTKTVSSLPSRAVRFDEKGAAFVYVIRDNDTVAVTPVTVLADNGQIVQLDGLAPGLLVVDAHLKRFADGQQVQAME